MRARRITVLAALALPLALAISGLPSVSSTAAPADSDRAVPTTGRFITTSRQGVVLVDENGKHRDTLIRARRAVIADLHPKTGTFIWSSRSGGATTWHITNLFGADLGDFNVPAGASTPAIDEGGYNAYWVRPFRGGDEAAIMRLEINDPQATPQAVLALGPGEAEQLTVSPDYQKIAVAVGGQVRLLSANGSIVETVPLPAGTTAGSGRVVWSPDSGRIAFLAGVPGQPVYSIHVASANGDHTPTKLAAGTEVLFDWAPDGSVLLGGSPGGPDLVGFDPATGATKATYSIDRTSGIFWSGLKKGKTPTDRIKPYVKISQPDCGERKGAACQRYRHTTRAWREVGGPVTDRGKSLVRYVIIAVFQKRGSSWWGLVGNGKRPTWRKFATRDEARYGAKERHAKLIGNRWEASIPQLTAGQLVVVAKARDGAGNDGLATVAADLG